ncbi:rhodanese-like domain-containing protein [Terasakiella sp.]|uniref:rhodanese-like domain-containing protein n=1 Tax=Terasakiella sp. TaxID=2034861 RepID=UPI003AA93197
MFRLLPISVFAVVLLCLGSAVQAQMISPEHVEGAETINAAQAKALFDQGAVFIDLRPQEDFTKGHIAAAININIAGAFNRNMIEKKIPKDQTVIFYCYGVHCLRSYTACVRAVSWGYQKVKYFRDGLPAWIAADYPVRSGI